MKYMNLLFNCRHVVNLYKWFNYHSHYQEYFLWLLNDTLDNILRTSWRWAFSSERNTSTRGKTATFRKSVPNMIT